MNSFLASKKQSNWMPVRWKSAVSLSKLFVISLLLFAQNHDVFAINCVNLVPQIEITDPCSCKNNATTLSNGQFGETIKITSTTGDVWTVTNSTGFFATLSPAPPAVPVPLVPGTLFVEMPAGSGNFFLSGIHVDALGYALTAVNQLGETLSISNSCQYPNPLITSGLNHDFCLGSPLVPLTGNPGDANVLSQGFTINGQTATNFNAAVLGIGTHIVEYTVDGALTKVIGPDDPGCIQKVQQVVNVIATPDVLVCDNLVNVSVDGDCISEILPDMILEGTYGCFDDYEVTLKNSGGANVANPIGPAQIGQTLTAIVTHKPSGNSCWGLVFVEPDNFPPVLNCQDLIIPCAITKFSPQDLALLGVANAFPNNAPWPSTGLAATGPNSFIVGLPLSPLFDNCTDITLSYSDVWTDFACGHAQDFSGQITRTWSAIDEHGNLQTCVQKIFFDRVHNDEVIFPADTLLSCENPDVDPLRTGIPYIVFNNQKLPLFPGQGFCELGITFHDIEFQICDGTTKYLREWTVFDWCLPLNPPPPDTNPIIHIQLIFVKDTTAPVFQCPPNISISTAAYDCDADFDLPDIFVSDNCSRIDTAYAEYSFGGIFHGIAGHPSDFFANNPWNPDTLVVFDTLFNIPQQTTTVRYVVVDDCGNSNVCQFDIEVQDNIPPVAVCKEILIDSLGPTGQLVLPAWALDDGSYANCINPWIKVRRLVPAPACQPNDRYFDLALFCCDDLNDTVLVVLKAWDVVVQPGPVPLNFELENSDSCIVRVIVRDGTPPICQAPANLTVTCENFNPTLATHGTPNAVDNCCVDTILQTLNYAQFDTTCRRGTLVRNFTAVDCGGRTSICSQRITVNYAQNYHIRFPDDVIATGCGAQGDFGPGPIFNRVECENMKFDRSDQIITTNLGGACFKIQRTFTVYNTCTYNPATPCVLVPNPMPNAAEDHPTNLVGPIVSPAGTAAPWAPTSVKLTPTAPAATNFSTFWSATANCYRYVQNIKVNDVTRPDLDSCWVNGCDPTPNDQQLWNDPAWFDPNRNSQDLFEGPSTLTVTASDDCGGTNVTIEGFLFLNLDGDTIRETVIPTSNMPTNPGVINYDNHQNPNFTGGALREFDQRPVAINQKYRFALQQIVANNKRRATIRWNTQAAPNTYVAPQLPHGSHKMRWVVGDGCGNRDTCDTEFTVRDCIAPTLTCATAPVNLILSDTASNPVFAIDFLSVANDNDTPTGALQYAIRKNSPATGFPLDVDGNPISSLNFTCDDVGQHQIQLWTKDIGGNTASCLATLKVVDIGVCSGTTATVTGALRINPSNPASGLEAANILISGSPSPGASPINLVFRTDSTGFFLSDAIPIGGNYTVTPNKNDDWLNGVTTLDLLQISKHILGVQPLTTPYLMLAADANSSGSITTFDVLEIRKLILGIYQELPSTNSWIFVPKNDTLNAQNPFAAPINHSIQLNHFLPGQKADFVAVKMGDANNSAIPNNLLAADDRSGGTVYFDLENMEIKKGETATVHFTPSESLNGYQFTLNTPNLEILDLLPGKNLTLQNFGIFPGEKKMTVAADVSGESNGFSIVFKAEKDGSFADMLRIGNQITKVEAYAPGKGLMDIALRFKSKDGEIFTGNTFELLQNTPNPAAEGTTIAFNLPESGNARLTISNSGGQIVKVLENAFTRGLNSVSFVKGELPEGLLFYRLDSGMDSAVRKMVVEH